MVNLIQIWRNRSKIAEGITNTIIKRGDIEEVAARRMEICNTCDHIDRQGSKCTIPGTAPCCGLCGCVLKFKTRSMSASCDDKRWTALVTPEEEDELNSETNYDPYE